MSKKERERMARGGKNSLGLIYQKRSNIGQKKLNHYVEHACQYISNYKQGYILTTSTIITCIFDSRRSLFRTVEDDDSKSRTILNSILLSARKPTKERLGKSSSVIQNQEQPK